MAKHSHKCRECGHIFTHDTNRYTMPSELYDKAHDCPKCGHQEFRRYSEFARTEVHFWIEDTIESYEYREGLSMWDSMRYENRYPIIEKFIGLGQHLLLCYCQEVLGREVAHVETGEDIRLMAQGVVGREFVDFCQQFFDEYRAKLTGRKAISYDESIGMFGLETIKRLGEGIDEQ